MVFPRRCQSQLACSVLLLMSTPAISRKMQLQVRSMWRYELSRRDRSFRIRKNAYGNLAKSWSLTRQLSSVKAGRNSPTSGRPCPSISQYIFRPLTDAYCAASGEAVSVGAWQAGKS